MQVTPDAVRLLARMSTRYEDGAYESLKSQNGQLAGRLLYRTFLFRIQHLECLTRSDAPVAHKPAQIPKSQATSSCQCVRNFEDNPRLHASPTQHGNPDAGIGHDGSKLGSVRVSKVLISLDMAVGELWLIPSISSTQLFLIVMMVDGSTVRMTL